MNIAVKTMLCILGMKNKCSVNVKYIILKFSVSTSVSVCNHIGLFHLPLSCNDSDCNHIFTHALRLYYDVNTYQQG